MEYPNGASDRVAPWQLADRAARVEHFDQSCPPSPTAPRFLWGTGAKDEAWTTPPTAVPSTNELGQRDPPPGPRARHLRRIHQPDPPPPRLQQPRPRHSHLAAPERVRALPKPRRRPALPAVEPQPRTRPVQHHRRLPAPVPRQTGGAVVEGWETQLRLRLNGAMFLPATSPRSSATAGAPAVFERGGVHHRAGHAGPALPARLPDDPAPRFPPPAHRRCICLGDRARGQPVENAPCQIRHRAVRPGCGQSGSDPLRPPPHRRRVFHASSTAPVPNRTGGAVGEGSETQFGRDLKRAMFLPAPPFVVASTLNGRCSQPGDERRTHCCTGSSTQQ